MEFKDLLILCTTIERTGAGRCSSSWAENLSERGRERLRPRLFPFTIIRKLLECVANFTNDGKAISGGGGGG